MKLEKTTLHAVLVAILIFTSIHAATAQTDDFITTLNEKNIREFLEKTQNISLGQKGIMLPDDIATYLDRHLAPKSEFSSMTKFEIPGFPAQTTEMKLKKEEYIANIIEGQNSIIGYETTITINEIKISAAGSAAVIITSSDDRGKMPWPDGQGSEKIVPIKGHSECEQRLIVSLNNYIQMANAKCTTTISFLPFGDTPLGE